MKIVLDTNVVVSGLLSAQGNPAQVLTLALAGAAELSHLNRESLYRLISRRGNPRLSSLDAVLSALGLKVTFAAA